MSLKLLCRKIGMTQLFQEDGTCVPVTVLEAERNAVVQAKTEAKDGYLALQLGVGSRPAKRTSKPMAGHYQKAEVAPKRELVECRVTAEEAEAHPPGSDLGVELFEAGQRVDVIGKSKGRGTAVS